MKKSEKIKIPQKCGKCSKVVASDKINKYYFYYGEQIPRRYKLFGKEEVSYLPEIKRVSPTTKVRIHKYSVNKIPLSDYICNKCILKDRFYYNLRVFIFCLCLSVLVFFVAWLGEEDWTLAPFYFLFLMIPFILYNFLISKEDVGDGVAKELYEKKHLGVSTFTRSGYSEMEPINSLEEETPPDYASLLEKAKHLREELKKHPLDSNEAIEISSEADYLESLAEESKK